MSQSINLAFIDDPEPAKSEVDRQFCQSYQRLSALKTADNTSLPVALAISQMQRLDLAPLDDPTWYEATIEQATPASQPHPAVQRYADAPAPQAPRSVGNPAGRKLLAAVMRRVRAL
jgi:hypothetical protein